MRRAGRSPRRRRTAAVAYRFDGLAPGAYTLHEQQPPGYFQGGQCAGSGGGDDSLEDLIRDIAVGSSQQLIDYNFCEMPPAVACPAAFFWTWTETASSTPRNRPWPA